MNEPMNQQSHILYSIFKIWTFCQSLKERNSIMRYLLIFLAVNAVNVYAASNRLDLDKFTGIQEIKMNAAFSYSYDNIAFGNVRILSDQTDLDDYVQLFYEMNPQTVNLEFKNSVVYKDIGVVYYKEAIFMKDVSSDFEISRSGKSYNSNKKYSNMQSFKNSPFIAYLEAGMSLSFFLQYQSDDYHFIVENCETGKIIRDSYAKSNSTVVISNTRVLESGMYNIYINPLNKDKMTYDFTFNNENRNLLSELRNRQTFSASFLYGCDDYAKWKVFLNKGEKIEISPSYYGDNLSCFLIFEDSTIRTSLYGDATVVYVAEKTGNYYIVYSTDIYSGSVEGTIKITDPDPSTGLNNWQMHEFVNNEVRSNEGGLQCIKPSNDNIIPHDEFQSINNRSIPLDGSVNTQ